MSDLRVFAVIRPKPQHRDEVLAILQGIVPLTRDEAGCRRFELSKGVGDDSALYLTEAWDSEAALTAHHAMPYTVAAAARIDGKLARETEVIQMRPAGP